MDNYHAIHGHDVSNFDLPSTHRLPTVSAAQALEDLTEDHSRIIPTGLDDLDRLLSGPLTENGDESVVASAPTVGGIQKGQVTEIWGPPGVGKSIFAVELAVSALRHDNGVVWIDAFNPLCSARLTAAIKAQSGPDAPALTEQSTRFTRFLCPTLAHLIALVCRPSPLSIPTQTGLIIIDSLSALVNHAFPRNQDSADKGVKTPAKGSSNSAGRAQFIQYITGSLQKLAAARGIAIVVLTQCATTMQAERGASVRPAIAGMAWEQCISTRLVLFQDWLLQDGQVASARFVGIQKLDGNKDASQTTLRRVAFGIHEGGISAISFDESQQSLSFSTREKRRFTGGDFEIPDSDEEFGWGDDDDMPPLPSQWQGSEDIILGQSPKSDVDQDRVSDEDLAEESANEGDEAATSEANPQVGAERDDPNDTTAIDT